MFASVLSMNIYQGVRKLTVITEMEFDEWDLKEFS